MDLLASSISVKFEELWGLSLKKSQLDKLRTSQSSKPDHATPDPAQPRLVG